MDSRLERPPGASATRAVTVRRDVEFRATIEADPRDPISRELSLGVFPPLCRPGFELAEALTPPGGRVLDLGAHVGTFALAVASIGRRVIAVEPSPRNFELLDASRRINHLTRLATVHAAAIDAPGMVGFIPAGPFGHVTPDLSPVGGLDVPAVAADDLLGQFGWDRVDFIKMDVEGAEVAALIGLSGLLRRPDAPPLLVESNGHTLGLLGETPDSLKATLGAYGYRLYQVEGRRLIPIALDEFQPTTVVDYLAVKATPVPPRRWRVDAPLTRRDRLRRIRASLRSSIEPERAYIAAALARSTRPIGDIATPRRAWYAPWRN